MEIIFFYSAGPSANFADVNSFHRKIVTIFVCVEAVAADVVVVETEVVVEETVLKHKVETRVRVITAGRQETSSNSAACVLLTSLQVEFGSPTNINRINIIIVIFNNTTEHFSGDLKQEMDPA